MFWQIAWNKTYLKYANLFKLNLFLATPWPSSVLQSWSECLTIVRPSLGAGKQQSGGGARQGWDPLPYNATQLYSPPFLYHTIQLGLAPTLFYCRGILHHSTQLLSIPLWLLFNSSRSSARHGSPFYIQCKATLGSTATQLNYFITTLQWTKKIGPKKLYSCTTLSFTILN